MFQWDIAVLLRKHYQELQFKNFTCTLIRKVIQILGKINVSATRHY